MANRTLSPNSVATESLCDKDARVEWTHAGHWDPGFKKAVCDSIDRLSHLKPNWDGYGAPAIRPDVIDAAKRFVLELPDNLCYRPQVTPMSPGNLQLEWHQGTKLLELEFETPKT